MSTESAALAVAASRKWCGTTVGDVGPFETFLATLPPVIGLGFGAYSEWSSEVDKLIGQMAELGGQVSVFGAACSIRSASVVPWEPTGAWAGSDVGPPTPSPRGCSRDGAVPPSGP